MSMCWTLIAQAPTTAPAPAGDAFWGGLVPIGLMIVVFYFIVFRGQRKDRQRHEQMLNTLQRNDRVQTVGGIYGTVVDVRDTDVVLKIDETNNVKVRFNRAAIKEVIREPSSLPAKAPAAK